MGIEEFFKISPQTTTDADIDFFSSENKNMLDILKDEQPKIKIIEGVDNPLLTLMRGDEYTASRGVNFESFTKTKAEDTWARIQRNGDVVDDLYLMFKLTSSCRDDNIDYILDSLADSLINFSIGGLSILKLSLGLLYFLTSYLDDKMYFIDIEKLREEQYKNKQIFGTGDVGSFIVNKMLALPTEFEGKYIILPIAHKFLIKNFPLISMQYHEFIMRFTNKTKDPCKNMITEVLLASVHIYLSFGPRCKLTQTLIEMHAITVHNRIDELCEEKLHTISICRVPAIKYIMVMIMPDYDKIDPDNRDIAVNLLPFVQKVEVLNENKSTILMVENADIRRSKSQHMYLFPGNPHVTLSSWVKQHMNESKALLDIVYDENSTMNTKNTEYFGSLTGDKILVSLTAYALPIKIDVSVFVPNCIRVMSGMFGTLCS